MDASQLADKISPVDRLWFLEIFVGLVIIVGVSLLFKIFVRKEKVRSLSKRPGWKASLGYILSIPFYVLMWILAITLVVEVLAKRFDFSFFNSYLDAFRSTGFVFCLSWMLLRWKKVFQHRMLAEQHKSQEVDVGLVHVLGKLITVIIVVLAFMFVFQLWGLNIGPLLAFGGIGAAAIGFSAKDVLSNFFGGVMLHINRPFVIGDFVRLPSQSLEGVVEEIGWNTSTIRDRDKRPMYLPNSTFSHAVVLNYSRMTHRRILETVGVRYDDFSKIPLIVEALKQKIDQLSHIDHELPVIVVFNKFGASSLDLMIDFYTLKTRYDLFLEAKHEVLMIVYEELRKFDAEVPFLTVSLQGKVNAEL